jgi:hypothetical protein
MDDRYGTAAGFRAYHIARGNDVPAEAVDDDVVNEWLLVGSEWLDGRYQASFPGLKVGMRAQLREWPRLSAFDIYEYAILSTSIPREVEAATYEAALRQGVAAGSLSVDYTPGKYKRAAVDGAINVEFAGFNSAFDTQKQIPIIDQILFPILTGSGNVSALSGSAVRA